MRVGEKIRELNDLSPPEHTHTLTHTETQTEGAHSTPPSVYIRDVLHTQMTALWRIFSSEVMLEAADFHRAELLLLVYTGHLWYWYPGLYLACREHPLILLGFSLCIANISP